MKVILVFLLSSLVYSQSFEAVTVSHSIVSGYATYHLSMDRDLKSQGNSEYIKHNRKWHTYQSIELSLSIGAGALLLYNNYDEKIDWKGIIKDVLFFTAVRWTVRDGVYNSLIGENFFHQSSSTTAALEPYGDPYVKISFLLVAILVKYVLF